MQNEETDFPQKKKGSAKNCCLLALAVVFACFLLALSALACFIVADSADLKGEDYTFSRRVKRYKVACQFIWVDFKDWVSGKSSDEPPPENDPSR